MRTLALGEMHTYLDPPLETWRLAPNRGLDRAALAPLVQRVQAEDPPPLDTSQPIIATGHQAWLWHPGILAKDIAAVSAARRLNATALHVVVDHDVLDPLRLELPVQRDDRLEVETLHLGRANPALPTGAQPAVDPAEAISALTGARDRLGEALVTDVQPLIEAIESTRRTRYPSLAHQISAWTAILMRPWCGDVPHVPASALLQTPPGRALVQAMLADARRCIGRYNDAVAAHPEAGIAPLVIERERVELPMWALCWNGLRQRVFADLADRAPLLTLEDGTPIDTDDGAWLAPRALLLTALMRAALCDLFIHGKGGGAYDRITEQWWRTWRGEPLAPMAVVSADAHLSFDVPLADRAALARARWQRHHVPFNVDRLLHLDGPLVAQKQRLIQRMHADGQLTPRRARRRQHWLAFREIHRINAELCRAHPQVLDDADRQLATARLGLTNARIAGKRDWCFALYPAATLEALRGAIEHPAPVCP